MRGLAGKRPIERENGGRATNRRAAALDMGSNAIRYSIAAIDGAYPLILESGRFAIRLGHDTFRGGDLSARTAAGVVRVLADFRSRLDEWKIDRYRAIATSAIRDSRNGPELVETIRQKAGIHLEVISGEEEARLVWVAVRAKLGMDRTSLLADLGGGSLEISLVSAERIHWTESYPLGTVRLLTELGRAAEDESEVRSRVDAVEDRIAQARHETDLGDLIITGGNADALGDLVDTGTDPDRTTDLTREDLAGARELLGGMSVSDRVERLGLREDRADVILTAAIIFERLAELAGTTRLVVPRVGVQHGLLAEIALQGTYPA